MQDANAELSNREKSRVDAKIVASLREEMLAKEGEINAEREKVLFLV